MAERIGKYEVVELIGRGGMGTIYRARDSVLERSVALKVVSSFEVTPELRVRFFREAQACARLSHPNIVTIHDMGEDGGRLFIVMELLEGEELRQLIARRAPLALEPPPPGTRDPTIGPRPRRHGAAPGPWWDRREWPRGQPQGLPP
jgi:eukaryotic-like serine/threonine-protein kinase